MVASMVGYSQLNNFYVHFKNYFRISPGALRDYGGSCPEESSGGPAGAEEGNEEIQRKTS